MHFFFRFHLIENKKNIKVKIMENINIKKTQIINKEENNG